MCQLGPNPYNCTCDLPAHLLRLRTYNFAFGEAKCASPNHLAGYELTGLQVPDLGCDTLTMDYERPAVCRFSANVAKTTVIMNCSNAGLTEVPPIPTTDQIEFDSLELHIENNSITDLPNVHVQENDSGTDYPTIIQNQKYGHLRKIFASNNKIKP